MSDEVAKFSCNWALSESCTEALEDFVDETLASLRTENRRMREALERICLPATPRGEMVDIARAALTQTSGHLGVTTCEICKCSTWPGADRPAHAPACPHYQTNRTGAAPAVPPMDPVEAILATKCPDCPMTVGEHCGFDEDYRDYFHPSRIRAALATPQSPTCALPAVPRGHCGRCDRCGWPMGSEKGQCRPLDCSMRPLPAERPTCAGCGAPFEARPSSKCRTCWGVGWLPSCSERVPCPTCTPPTKGTPR